MPKRTDIKKILVIGSGPIIIGQAAEFDYAGTQACLALKEEGYEVILLNSNPATIMTDTKIADKVYMEPLTLEYVAKIIRYERPDAIIPNMGGQTGLNLAMQLEKKGILEECQVELIGMDSRCIERAEDRELFKELCIKLGVPVIPSQISYSTEEALEIAHELKYPVVLRPAFTLGGTGGGFANNDTELKTIMKNALAVSPVHQVLVEKSVKGYKEIEFEVMRDKNDTTICICSMENIDPVGIHTGDSIVVAPVQTLTSVEYNILKESAFNIVRELGVQGGCNVQFALDPQSLNYYIIEVNPRVSRSSALASKASGYPIARVSTKIAIGMTLDEIKLESSVAATEPTLDYVVAKMPRFAFDKFVTASNSLSTQMKATGEVMSIGRTIEESILKAVRSLEVGALHLHMKKFDGKTKGELLNYLKNCPSDGIFAIAELLRQKTDLGIICNVTQIDMFFLNKIKNIIDMEDTIKETAFGDLDVLYKAKVMGFGDNAIATLWGVKEDDVYNLRKQNKMFPVYKMIDTCAGEFLSYIPFFYSTYEKDSDSIPSNRQKIIVLGAGPIRIGQGVEFDYSTVHAVDTIRNNGYEAIIINNNPETVSTDYTTSDKLYFEPLTVEDVSNIIEFEKPIGVVASLGGQTAINLAEPLMERGVKIIGTDYEAINNAEDRDAFEKIMEELGIPQPQGRAVTTIEAGIKAANEVGYPVMVRPSYVLGGRAMQIVSNEEALITYLNTAVSINSKHPVLVDHYIQGKELEVDAICDGESVFIPGIMQHIEKTGVHSGDSISVYPTFSVSQNCLDKIIDYTQKLGFRIGIKGIYNIQFIVDDKDDVYVIEVNPRSSRTVPFISKATGYMLADIATLVILGKTLKEQGITEVCPPNKKGKWYVKTPVFSFNKLFGADAYLSPEMKSTGEAIGYDKSFTRALYKALQAGGTKVINYGSVFITVSDKDKPESLELIKRFYNLGFNIEATKGTATYFKANGIRTKIRKKLSEGSDEILTALRQGHISYVINTKDINTASVDTSDGFKIRRCAVENNIPVFTSLDTVRALLDVLEEITLCVSTVDS